MRLPENVYVIVDYSDPCENGSDFVTQVILHKVLVPVSSWVRLYHKRDHDYETVRFTDTISTCLTIVDYNYALSVGDVIVSGDVYDKFGTYWHHGAFDKEIEEILKQHKAYSDGHNNQKHI